MAPLAKKTGGGRTSKARLNLRVPHGLLLWAKKYAMEKNKTVTQVIIDHFTELKEKHGG
jgi:hypothetical protein